MKRGVVGSGLVWFVMFVCWFVMFVCWFVCLCVGLYVCLFVCLFVCVRLLVYFGSVRFGFGRVRSGVVWQELTGLLVPVTRSH